MAESVLAKGHSDLISMARPFLADPFFMKKAEEGRGRLCLSGGSFVFDILFHI